MSFPPRQSRSSDSDPIIGQVLEKNLAGCKAKATALAGYPLRHYTKDRWLEAMGLEMWYE